MVCLKRWHDGEFYATLQPKWRILKLLLFTGSWAQQVAALHFLLACCRGLAPTCLPLPSIQDGRAQQGKIHFALASNQVPKSTLYTWQPIKTQQSLWNRKTNITDILWISKIIYREMKNSRCSRWCAGRALGWWLNLGFLDVQVHIPLLYVFQ